MWGGHGCARSGRLFVRVVTGWIVVAGSALQSLQLACCCEAVVQSLAFMLADMTACTILVAVAPRQLLHGSLLRHGPVMQRSMEARFPRQRACKRFGLFEDILGVAGSPTFKTVVERVKGVVQDAVANADIPFHQVVDAVAAARSAAYTPVFQTQLTLEGWAGEPETAGDGVQGRMGDLRTEPVPVRCDVSLRCILVRTLSC